MGMKSRHLGILIFAILVVGIDLLLIFSPIWATVEMGRWEVTVRGKSLPESLPNEVKNYRALPDFNSAVRYTDRAHGNTLCILTFMGCMNGASMYYLLGTYRVWKRTQVSSSGSPSPLR